MSILILHFLFLILYSYKLLMKILFRVYQWLVAAPIILVLTIVIALLTIFGSFVNSNWWGFYPPKFWARCWCWLFFVKVEVVNSELIDKKQSYVFIANHQGVFDIFSVYGYLTHNFKWMMRKGLNNIPLIGLACNAAGHIMVDNSTPTAIKKTMDVAKKKLSNGMSLFIFPEGRRTYTGKMGSFKHGAFKLALDFNLPIVPITISGSYDVMPRTTFNIKPGKITITLHEPIYPTECGHDFGQVIGDCYRIIQKDLPQNLQNPDK